MSSSETDFSRWLSARYAASEGFTALILLVAIREQVDMLACAYLHVIGDDITWPEMRGLIDQSGKPWDGVAIFAENAVGGGPVIDVVAASRLQDRIDQVTADRMVLNEAGFFDPRGRAIRIDPA
ncbi:hypothetical protein [Polymorphum gilvum]|uniref:Uncharacterized protein n=1 Tax=Polymorphum gilvum (strain LMG 25793 / CGMCC 1.9160 / SL003B-26A1) TaxID=991905 RepID=F2J1D3_POLGS|nr:hypothetical protein [Polymorphum gilvum]ADZ69715.1 hypothetical protein SL003B_1287 [Polymorphum gilvum SL003B-26A1]